MTQAEELALLSGGNIAVLNGLHIRQIKLRELSDGDAGGLDHYHQMLSIISMSREDILKCLKLEDRFSQLPEAEQKTLTAYRLLVQLHSLRQCLHEALSFFIVEPLQYVDATMQFRVVEGSASLPAIGDDTYPQVRRAIMQTNYLAVEDAELQKFKGKKARAIYERMMAGRAAAQKKKAQAGADESLTLPCIISAICARHNSVNLLNIWDLTVYQLYDQFAQLNKNFQVDVSSLKWAAWGTEQFDFTLWYKNMKT